jgi:dihydropteroate synthase
MQLFGVLNASPDSLNLDSIVRTSSDASKRAELLVAEGVFGFDLGGQGSTFQAAEVSIDDEWERLAPIVPVLAAYGRPFSVDTWRPATARRALEAGANWINAADGLQQDAMLEVAAEFGCPVVLPFLSGPDPLRLARVLGDPVETILEFFEAMLRRCDRYGIRERVVIDPGTGFAPHDWPWEDRFVYQKQVYANLDRLRVFGLPLYIALPWKDTAQHAELMDIIVAGDPEYGRVHYPHQVRSAEARRAAGLRPGSRAE